MTRLARKPQHAASAPVLATRDNALMVVHALSQLLVVCVVAWFAGALILRLVAISCVICATALLAVGHGALAAPAGVAAFGLACWLVSELLHRGRRGYWRSVTLARLSARASRPAGARAHGST